MTNDNSRPTCTNTCSAIHKFWCTKLCAKLKMIQHRYLKTRLNYYSNSTATFHDQILRAGDVDPNPGPAVVNRDHQNMTSHTPKDSTIFKYTCDRLFDIGNHYKNMPLAPNVWSHIVDLGINSRPPSTHRGVRGGVRKRQHAHSTSRSFLLLPYSNDVDNQPDVNQGQRIPVLLSTRREKPSKLSNPIVCQI